MATRATPRRSTRSQSRELSVLLSEDEGAPDASSSSQVSDGTVKRRKPRASTRKVKKPETILEDEQVIIESIAGSEAEEDLVIREEVVIEEVIEESLTIEDNKITADAAHLSEFNSLAPPSETSAETNKLRQAVIQLLERMVRFMPFMPPFLIAASCVLGVLLLSPNQPFARKVYVDENALQPGSANVEWGWSQVELADQIANRIASVAESSAEIRAALLSRELLAIGLTPHNQSYTFTIPSESNVKTIAGINTYARFPAARGNGREAFVIAASWKSAWDGTDDPDAKQESTRRESLEGAMSDYDRKQVRKTNVRGIASAIIIARHLSGFSHWSKDLLLVFGDGEMDGMQAWTSSYFGRQQSNLVAEKLHCGNSAVWNALAIDYPSDSFSHIVVKHEGLQGQLPNMDVINTFTRIAQKTDGIPVTLAASSEHDATWGEEPLGSLGKLLERHLWKDGDGSKKYLSGLLNVAKQVGFLSSGQPSGIHGLFHRYHVDAITIFLQPAPGPYGFYHIGKAVEYMTRSMSNLLERLHHSQFFYLLTSPYRFIEVGKYLPVAALLSAALSITGFCIWSDEGKRAFMRKSTLIYLLRVAIEEESVEADSAISDDGYAMSMSPKEVPLTNPTSAQLLSTFISLLVDRSLKRGDLLGRTKLRSSTALLHVLGRPLASAVAIVLSCHAIGGYAYYVINKAPVDCAANGIQHCKPLRLITVVSLLFSLLLVWRIRRASNRLLQRCFLQSQHHLPEGLMPFLVARQSFRVEAIARTVHMLALLEAGMLLLAISLVNFSLALVLGCVICLPFCAARLPGSASMALEDLLASSAKRHEIERSVSPASDDTDHVELLTPSLPLQRQSLAIGTRLRLLSQSGLYFALTPMSILYLLKGLSHLLSRLGEADPFSSSTLLDSTFDSTLLQHHILGTLTLPFITLAYLPLVLIAFVASTLAALS